MEGMAIFFLSGGALIFTLTSLLIFVDLRGSGFVFIWALVSSRDMGTRFLSAW